MENLKDYITFEKYQENNEENNEEKYNICKNILFTILRMFIEANVINMDLNYGNIMFKSVGNKIYIKLIDFGNIKYYDKIKKNIINVNFLKEFYDIISKYTNIISDCTYNETEILKLINQYKLLPNKENLANTIEEIPILEIILTKKRGRNNLNNNNNNRPEKK